MGCRRTIKHLFTLPAQAKTEIKQTTMTNKNILTNAILAALGVALSSTSAQAGSINYTTGDLLLGVRQGSAGATADYIVDLGQYTAFDSSPAPFTVTNIGADLSALWGGSWSTRTDLFWSVVGTAATPKTNTLFATAAEPTPGTAATSPHASASNSTQAVPAGKFNNVGNAATLSGNTAGTSLNANSIRQLTSDTNSWASFTGGTQSFTGNTWAYFAGGSEAAIGSGAALDLFRITNTTGSPAATNVNLGYFTLGSSGDLTFGSPSPVPVPEPAGIAVGILAGFTALTSRRRQRATVA
jgi:hypothetical protein